MKDNKNKDVEDEIIENIEDMEEEDDVIILTDDEGIDREFDEIALIELNEKFYSVLEPKEVFGGLEDGDVMIFEVSEDEEGFEVFLPIEDEETLNAVFTKFMELVEEDEEGSETEEVDE